VVARGVPLAGLLAELTGWGGAINKAKGGSMHLTSVEHACYGSYAIVGGHVPIACGSAYASQMLGDSAVTAVFFGEGATNIGAFHEALNLAAVWQLPIVFVCENNLYAEYSAAQDQSLLEHPAVARAGGNGIVAAIVDGNDVDEVYAAVGAAATYARAGSGPVLLECKTYRHFGHSRDDPAKYRPEEEVAAWLERDPIRLERERLTAEGVSDLDLDALDRAAVAEMDAAEAAGRAAGEIDQAVVMTDVWASEETRWRN
jgi:pyruvate dehydrogenase E1 component alpha subunit